MGQAKQNRIIAVDTETGIYWHGEDVLRTAAMIKTVIEQIKASKL